VAHLRDAECVVVAGQQIGLADEVRDKARARVFIELVGRVDLGHTPGLHHHHAVADGQGFGLVMSHHQGGDAHRALDTPDFKLHLFTQVGVEVGQRLIEQQHRRFDHQRTGQGHALTLATGQLTGVALGMLSQAHQLQHAVDAGGDVGRWHLAHLQAEGNVVAHAHMREQRVALKHHAQATAGGFGVGNVATVEQDLATADVDETGDHLQGGGLATA